MILQIDNMDTFIDRIAEAVVAKLAGKKRKTAAAEVTPLRKLELSTMARRAVEEKRRGL